MIEFLITLIVIAVAVLVHLCVLLYPDGRFKMISNCFYDKEAAERYADGNPQIKIQKLSVI